MQVQLEQIRYEPYRWSEVRSIPAASLHNSEIVDLGEIAWQGEIRYAAPAFRLTAVVEYQQTVRCMRCLEPVVRPVRSELDLAIFQEGADVSPGDHELGASDFGVVYADSEVFDLEPLLLDQLQLDVPMRVLCREDCRGLCPTCGENRNLGACSCEPRPIDPRWAPLESLHIGRSAGARPKAGVKPGSEKRKR